MYIYVKGFLQNYVYTKLHLSPETERTLPILTVYTKLGFLPVEISMTNNFN